MTFDNNFNQGSQNVHSHFASDSILLVMRNKDKKGHNSNPSECKTSNLNYPNQRNNPDTNTNPNVRKRYSSLRLYGAFQNLEFSMELDQYLPSQYIELLTIVLAIVDIIRQCQFNSQTYHILTTAIRVWDYEVSQGCIILLTKERAQ